MDSSFSLSRTISKRHFSELMSDSVTDSLWQWQLDFCSTLLKEGILIRSDFLMTKQAEKIWLIIFSFDKFGKCDNSVIRLLLRVCLSSKRVVRLSRTRRELNVLKERSLCPFWFTLLWFGRSVGILIFWAWRPIQLSNMACSHLMWMFLNLYGRV